MFNEMCDSVFLLILIPCTRRWWINRQCATFEAMKWWTSRMPLEEYESEVPYVISLLSIRISSSLIAAWEITVPGTENCDGTWLIEEIRNPCGGNDTSHDHENIVPAEFLQLFDNLRNQLSYAPQQGLIRQDVDVVFNGLFCCLAGVWKSGPYRHQSRCQHNQLQHLSTRSCPSGPSLAIMILGRAAFQLLKTYRPSSRQS